MKKQLLFLIGVLIHVTLQAQTDTTSIGNMVDIDLEDLMNIKVSTASKNSEGIQEAPAIISIVTAQEIQSYGALTLTDVLNRTTDLYMTGSYYFPNNLAGMRGDVQTHTSSHVLILIDGRPCRESFYGGVDLAVYNAFPVASIDRIEIIRGPGSVLYGSNAVSGVINIITKQPESTTGMVSSSIGSFGTKTISFLQALNEGDFKLTTAAQYMDQQGWNFTAVDQNGIKKSTNYGQQNFGLNLSMSYKNVSFKSFYGNSARDIFGERPLWNTDGSFNTLNTHRGFADLGFKHDFSKKWKSSLNVTYNYFDQSSIRDARPVKFLSNDVLSEMTHYIDINDKFHIVAGALANVVTGVGKGTDSNTDQPVELVKNYNDLRWATYVQADYKLVNFLKLIGGAQFNKTPGTEGNLSPRGGFILNFSPSFGMKGLYGQAFKSASQSERFTIIPNVNYGNPNLKPELISTTDAQFFFIRPKIQVTAGGFYSYQKNSIVRIPYLTNAIIYTNQGSLSMKGLEGEVKINITKFFSINSNASYQTNVNNLQEKDVTAISNLMIKGGVSYRNKLIDLGIFNSWFSKPSDVINSQSKITDTTKLRKIVNPIPKAFSLLSMNVNLNINAIFGWVEKPCLLLNFYGDNLLNQKIYNPEFSRRNVNSLPARGGIALYGGLTVKF